MDRKGKQKISFICLVLGVIALFAILFFWKTSYDVKIFEEEKKELSTIYPELSEELSENVSYYSAKSIQTDFWVMLVIMFLIVILLTGTYFIFNSLNKIKLKEMENELDFIYEQLLCFQNGNFNMLPLPEESSSHKFGDVNEKLKELGFFFLI